MTDITFEPNDERALAFIDTQDIIKHLENLGYQVIDKSEHGDVLEEIKNLEMRVEELEDEFQASTDEINRFM